MANTEVVKLNKSFVEIFEIEDNDFITVIDGWRIRVYFDDKFKGQIGIGRLIEVEHEGEITDPLSLKFKKII